LTILVLVAGSAGAGAARLPEAANPSWSPDGGQIAFAYFGVPLERLEVMGADGSGKHALYQSRNGCCEPVLWGASGRVVFVDDYRLFTVPESGGRPTELFEGTPWFILSPDRAAVAFDDGCGCGHQPESVALVDVRGGTPIVVPRPKNATDEIDGFSPDGTELVFTRRPWNDNGNAKGKSVLMVEHLHGGRPVPLARSGLIGSSFLPAGATAPQWSPDGGHIAFVLGGKLEIVSTKGGAPIALTPAETFSSFAWSPTSTRIAYAVRASKRKLELATFDLHGHRTVVSGAVNWVSGRSEDRPQWSPDGTKLVFMGLVGPNVPGRPPAGVWVVNADGTGLLRIA
jgi:hypothetical protein